jgi:hypothetical protein
MSYMQGLNGFFMERARSDWVILVSSSSSCLMFCQKDALGGETGKLAGTVELKHYI